MVVVPRILGELRSNVSFYGGRFDVLTGLDTPF